MREDMLSTEQTRYELVQDAADVEWLAYNHLVITAENSAATDQALVRIQAMNV